MALLDRDAVDGPSAPPAASGMIASRRRRPITDVLSPSVPAPGSPPVGAGVKHPEHPFWTSLSSSLYLALSSAFLERAGALLFAPPRPSPGCGSGCTLRCILCPRPTKCGAPVDALRGYSSFSMYSLTALSASVNRSCCSFDAPASRRNVATLGAAQSWSIRAASFASIPFA